MAAVVRPRGSAAVTRRWPFWVALLGGGLLIIAVALVFAWPSREPEGARFDLGSADDFSAGSVTTVTDGRFHLVRLDDGTFVALSWRDPHSGCTVPWRSNFNYAGRRGWFRDPCRGSTYRMDGRRVFGPSPRHLDRFPVDIVAGSVIVDTSRYVCGWAPPGATCVAPPSQR